MKLTKMGRFPEVSGEFVGGGAAWGVLCFGAGGTGGMVGRVDQPGGRFGLARLLPMNRQAGEVSRLVTSKAGSGR